eukprot:1572651-Pyramimonas_sp.AAC.1
MPHRTKATFLEHAADVLKHNALSQTCSRSSAGHGRSSEHSDASRDAPPLLEGRAPSGTRCRSHVRPLCLARLRE